MQMTPGRALAAIAVAALAIVLWRAAVAPAGESAATLTERVATLEAKLTAQRQAQDALRRDMDRLSSRFVTAQDTRTVGKSARVSAPVPAAPASPVSAQALSDERQAKLVSVGFTVQQASQITDDIDQVVLDRADLMFRAAREGGLDSAELAAGLRELPDPERVVREKYGDGAYDRYLYANLKPNRVVVRRAMGNSAAEQLGLERGDMIVSVNGEPVFSSADLVKITAAANSSSIPVTVRRGDDRIIGYVPPGPLGIVSGPGYARPDD